METHDLIFVVAAVSFAILELVAFLAERRRTAWRREGADQAKAFRRELEEGAHRA